MDMSQSKPIQDLEPADPRWKDLYQVGGIANIVVALTTVFAIVAFFIWPYEPGMVPTADIFATLQEDRLGGLVALDIVYVVAMLLSVLPVLALYVALKRVNESYALIALALGLMAIVALINARPIAELVFLSERYTAATTDVARSQYLAAGEALLTLFNGTAWMVNLVLASFSGLISCMLMLRTTIFSKAIAYFGIVVNIMSLLFFIPVVGLLLLFGATIGGVVFGIVVGVRFLELARRPILATVANS
jgi:hypothetical protein